MKKFIYSHLRFSISGTLLGFIFGCSGAVGSATNLAQVSEKNKTTLPATNSTPNSPNSEDIVGTTPISLEEESIATILKQLTGSMPALLTSGSVILKQRTSQQERKTTAQYLKEQFESFGISTRMIEFATPDGKQGFNVEATIPGEEDGRHLWVTAHLDTASNPGANDDASGLASVLLTAKALAKVQPKDTIHFVCFDLEEQGRQGSISYVRDVVLPLQKAKGETAILGAIHSDMIGYDRGPNKAVIANCGSAGTLSTAIKDAASAINSVIDFNEVCLPRSDHRSFWDAGLPAIMLVDSYMIDEYPWYHDKGDTAEKLNLPYMKSIIQTTIKAVALLAL